MFEGVIPAIVTPFDDEGAIRFDELRRHVAWMLESGCTAITGTGTVGEGSSLTRQERQEVIAAIVDAAGERPVIAGISAPTSAEAIAFAQDAGEAGAHGLMCLPPLLYDGDEREIRAFFEEVAGASSLPLQLYNNPHSSGGIDLPSQQIAELMRIERIVSVKECSGDARRIAELCQLDVDVMVGGDDWILEGGAAGATGWISGVANVAPGECVELWRLASSGELEPARAQYARLAALARLDMSPKLVQYFKAAMDAVGRFGGPCRPPRLSLTADEVGRMRAAVAALQAVSV